MKKFASTSTLQTGCVFVLLVAAALMLGGCGGDRVVVQAGGEPDYRRGEPGRQGPPPWAPAHGYRAKHRYRYYPDSEVYYDYGGGRWRVSVSLPRGIRLEAGEYVTLEMDTEKPYRHHGEVRRHYPPGQLKKKTKGKGHWK
jgi:hypothetical protein